MERFFKDLKTAERMQEGPWGSQIVSYATQLHVEGYTRQYGQSLLSKINLAFGRDPIKIGPRNEGPQ